MPTELDRVTITLPEGILPLLERAAEDDKRTVSNYVGKIVEERLRAAGLISWPEDRSEEILTAAQEIGPDRALEILQRAARKKGSK